MIYAFHVYSLTLSLHFRFLPPLINLGPFLLPVPLMHLNDLNLWFPSILFEHDQV